MGQAIDGVTSSPAAATIGS